MRKLRVNHKLNRTRLSDAYIENMTAFLQRSRNISTEEARAFVTSTMKTQASLPKIDVIATVAPGKLERKVLSFKQFLDISTKTVLTPSGSLYTPVTTIRSIVSELIKGGLAGRKKIKKLKFKAIAEGDMDLADKYDAEQNSIKVNLNALPGGFGSPSNLFYDKGGYNSVTSAARMLISNSFTCCEQLLGGNLPIFNVEEIFNLLNLCDTHGPSKETVDSVMAKFNMKQVSVQELSDYLHRQLSMYVPNVNFDEVGVTTYLNTMPHHVVQFTYYHSNLQHLVFDNDMVFRPILQKMFAFNNTYPIDPSITPEMFRECNGDSLAIVTTMLAKDLEGVKLQDMVDEHPDTARLVVQAYRHVSRCLNEVNDIFQVFVYHDLNYQNVLHRRLMQRKAVVVSDTDSVIYTAKEWAEWYVGHIDSIVQDSYNMSALVTYWLSEANADVMAKYAIGMGALGDDIKSITMKNEFLYPALLIYDTKKVYAGIIKVQEGIVMPTPEPDLKGAAIRGIDSSLGARAFIKELIIDDILNPTIKGTLSASHIISKVVSFEKDIWTSVSKGELQHLPIASCGTEENYADADRTKFFYAKAWNFIFGEKYGLLTPPDKLPMVKIKKPDEFYFAQLKHIDEKIHDKFKLFMETTKKAPTAFFIDPLVGGVPPELLPLIDTRKITHANVKPVYLTLDSLNIPVGNNDQQQLLSDIYGFDYKDGSNG